MRPKGAFYKMENRLFYFCGIFGMGTYAAGSLCLFFLKCRPFYYSKMSAPPSSWINDYPPFWGKRLLFVWVFGRVTKRSHEAPIPPPPARSGSAWPPLRQRLARCSSFRPVSMYSAHKKPLSPDTPKRTQQNNIFVALNAPPE